MVDVRLPAVVVVVVVVVVVANGAEAAGVDDDGGLFLIGAFISFASLFTDTLPSIANDGSFELFSIPSDVFFAADPPLFLK